MFQYIHISFQSSYNGSLMGSHPVPASARISRTSSPIAITSNLQDRGVLTARQVQIMTALDMDQGLVGIKGSRPSLETSWKRYLTITRAISKVGDIDWELGRKPADGEIIGVYIGKSAYYDQVKVLHHVRVHSDMIEWLQRDLDVGLDEETTRLWGYYKSSYTLRDLEKWVERKQKGARSDQKGKKKASVHHSQKGESSQKGKGKREEEGDDSTSSPPPKKSHKKSVGGRK
jgi:hypothetical protein